MRQNQRFVSKIKNQKHKKIYINSLGYKYKIYTMDNKFSLPNISSCTIFISSLHSVNIAGDMNEPLLDGGGVIVG